MAKMGRPKAEIDWELFEKLAEIPSSVLYVIHIADMLKVSKSTLERAVSEKYGLTIEAYRGQKEGPTRQKLYAKFWEQINNGNMTAIIWGTKNLFGWSDKIEAKQEVTQEVKAEIVYETEFGGSKEDAH